MDIGNRIKKLRERHGLTLEEIGEKVHFNYSNLSKIERGVRKPTLELLEQLSELMRFLLVISLGFNQRE
ncbi:helix-turn-helix transcriptional regulator [Neobacillus drentensis]|uniref:helix-turn-helix domain-containing protein n=1 Tax=Neobacillus drentensis TaxID=220684 RepID=UPI003B589805